MMNENVMKQMMQLAQLQQMEQQQSAQQLEPLLALYEMGQRKEMENARLAQAAEQEQRMMQGQKLQSQRGDAATQAQLLGMLFENSFMSPEPVKQAGMQQLLSLLGIDPGMLAQQQQQDPEAQAIGNWLQTKQQGQQ